MGILHPGTLTGWLRNLVARLSSIRRVRANAIAIPEMRRSLEEALVRMQEAVVYAKAVEEAAEIARARQIQQLAVVAHELRSPLVPMSHAVAILGRSLSGEAPRACLIIERQIAQMNRVIEDLIEMSRANRGRLALALEQVCLQDITDRAAEACKPMLERRRQRLLFIGSEMEFELTADPVRLLQILVNLLNNASKYSPDCSEIYLEIKVLESSVSIGVTDRGIGISAEALRSIFEPFIQEARATDFDRSGLGVGLSVVRDLVEAHGGHVTVSSEGAGRGSCFVVTLPRSDPVPGEAHARG